MQLGMVGLGRMGANLVRRLLPRGHACVVFDAQSEAVQTLAAEGAKPARDLHDLVHQLAAPRAIWVMLPAGDSTETTLQELAGLLSAGDILIDGGNTHYVDDVRRAQSFQQQGLRYLDVGTSGGVWGLARGYCLMIGGDASAFEHLDPIFRDLAPGRGSLEPTPGREGRTSTADQGYLYTGPAGSGHFVKMIHNGIEYGMMQAFAEGFDSERCGPVVHSCRAPLQPGSGGHYRVVATRQRGLVMVAGFKRHGPGAGSRPQQLFGACRRFGRGPLDLAGRD